MSLSGLVLRASAYRDHDLVVDVLTPERGRVALIARGARKSRRRFGGALEVGTRIAFEMSDRGRGLPTLTESDIVGALDAVRTDLDRFHQLAYALEILRLVTTEGEADARGYALACAFIDSLERRGPEPELLAAWELRMLAHHGFGLTLDRCVVTGEAADGLSLRAGGAVHRVEAGVPDAMPVPPRVLAVLTALNERRMKRFEPGDLGGVRALFARLWSEITGRALRTARFLQPIG